MNQVLLHHLQDLEVMQRARDLESGCAVGSRRRPWIDTGGVPWGEFVALPPTGTTAREQRRRELAHEQARRPTVRQCNAERVRFCANCGCACISVYGVTQHFRLGRCAEDRATGRWWNLARGELIPTS